MAECAVIEGEYKVLNENNKAKKEEKGRKDKTHRVINRNFSLGEYSEQWTKLERYLFIEIYNVIKDFYLSCSDENIKTFSSESILLTLPVDKLDGKLFKPSKKSRDLMNAAEGLSKKQINLKKFDEESEQWGFRFISMFPEITYDPSKNKNQILVRIPNTIYEEMVPIESYCQLDLKLLSEFNSGNTIRLYEIFKSYAFRKKFTISFDSLRRKLGFFKEGAYPEWKHFNAKVLKPAVKNINALKEYDIEVSYTKERGVDEIEFSITTHKEQNKSQIKILNLNDQIKNRKLNLIQSKYIDTLLKNCNKQMNNELQIRELKEWIISDLINMQEKQGENFDFKHAMNAISKQIRTGKYTKPYCHKYMDDKPEFDESIYQKIKQLELKGHYEKIRENFTKEQIIANRFGYILDN